MTEQGPRASVVPLAWDDQALGSIALPARELELFASFGSGLTRRAGDPPDIVWAVGDRGPNIKPKILIERYGLDSARAMQSADGAKVMPRLDVGPSIARLRVHPDRVELVDELRLQTASDAPVSGLPPPSSEHAKAEPVFDLQGKALPPDPSGLDTEGIAALADGGFWVADEFGPSLLRIDGEGRVLTRAVPDDIKFPDADYPVQHTLPAIAAKRQLNRGFECVALSPDGNALFIAFQSPLAYPDEATHKRARHVRLWRLDARTLTVTAQYAYPFDAPDTFVRDSECGKMDWSDLNVSELVALTDDELLVLERGSLTTKLYRVTLAQDCQLDPRHLEAETTPTLEQLSAAGEPLPQLGKQLIASSDTLRELVPDLEGMVVLSPTELLLVNDNDFGVEGARTSFAKLVFEEPQFPQPA